MRKIVSQEEVQRRFRAIDVTCKARGIVCKFYLFGSVLREVCSPNDVDILCVSTDLSRHLEIRTMVEDCQMVRSIDLTILTEPEERELDFIRTTGAKRIQ